MITVARREFETGKFTNDVYVDGALYASAVGDSLLDSVLIRIIGE